MDTNVGRLEAEIGALRADLARATREVHTLRQEVQAAKAELSCVSWQIRLRDQSDDFRNAVVVLIVITFVLFAALWRGLG